MLQVFLRYWCLMLLCSFMSTSAYYLPRLHNRVQSLQHISRSLAEKNFETPSSPYARRQMGRKMRLFVSRMQEQRRRLPRTPDQAFVDRLFKIFDANRDRSIEKGEFASILKYFDIISSSNRRS